MKNKPLRRCIACRNSKEKENLIRIVKNKNGNIEVDLECKKEGRGTYICNNVECLKKAEKNNYLSKVMKANIDQEIYDELRKIIENN